MTSRISVKVVPGASADEIVGWIGDVLKVRVSAPPERGRANAAVCALLAKALRVTDSQVTVVAGGASPRKIVEIPMSAPAARALLAADAD